MSEEERVEMYIRGNHFDPADPMHVAVYNRLRESGFDLPGTKRQFSDGKVSETKRRGFVKTSRVLTLRTKSA